MSEAFKKQVMHDGKSNFRNGQLVPMDRPCHIYKQMWAPYCFDIKIGRHLIGKNGSLKRKKRGDSPKRTSFTSHDGP